jgi:hypothetical protein
MAFSLEQARSSAGLRRYRSANPPRNQSPPKRLNRLAMAAAMRFFSHGRQVLMAERRRPRYR